MKTRTTLSIVSGKDVLSRIPAELSRYWPGGKAFIIADENTWKAAGEKVARLVAEAGLKQCKPFIFPAKPALHTDIEDITRLSRFIETLGTDNVIIPVAVGSGTINDIVKSAAHERGLSYLCVPTAPSVDGYTSFGSAVTINGFKTTLPCNAPKVVVADEGVMAAAPYPLLAAGYGDLGAKLASGRDWLIAEILGLEAIDPAIWELSQGKLSERLGSPSALARRESGVVRDIFDGLCDTGLAMQDQGDSRPASGAEHHISHCWEMRGLQVNGEEALHGEKVALGTLLTTGFAESLFSLDTAEVRRLASLAGETSFEERTAEVRQIFFGTGISSSVLDAAIQVSLEKLQFGYERIMRLEKICSSWEALRTASFRDRPKFAELSEKFASAGCPSFSALGIDAALAGWGLLAAQTIRNRYTILDLAWDLGVLSCIKDIVIQGM